MTINVNVPRVQGSNYHLSGTILYTIDDGSYVVLAHDEFYLVIPAKGIHPSSPTPYYALTHVTTTVYRVLPDDLVHCCGVYLGKNEKKVMAKLITHHMAST